VGGVRDEQCSKCKRTVVVDFLIDIMGLVTELIWSFFKKTKPLKRVIITVVIVLAILIVILWIA